MFLALTSASASPGISTTALALALNSPSARALLVEADPAGTSSTHAGYLIAARAPDWSLMKLVEPTATAASPPNCPPNCALPDTNVKCSPH